MGKSAEDNFLERIFSLCDVHLHHLRCCFIGHLKNLTRNFKSEAFVSKNGECSQRLKAPRTSER